MKCGSLQPKRQASLSHQNMIESEDELLDLEDEDAEAAECDPFHYHETRDPAERNLQMATLVFEIPHLQTTQRVDAYLTERVKYATRNRVQKAIAEGRVWIDGQVVKKNSRRLHAGERLELSLLRPAPEEMKPQAMALDIYYEDESLLVLCKPPGLAVHPTYRHWHGTLANGLLYYFRRQLNDPEAKIKPGLIHRLDKDTSGLMVVGKTPEAKRKLSRQFEYRQIRKVYRALVWGMPAQTGGLLETNLGPSKALRTRQGVYPYLGREGKPARTAWKVLQGLNELSLVEVELFTGRTHQIRAHLAHLGHPILGDALYGGLASARSNLNMTPAALAHLTALLPRQALHAAILGFTHPLSGEALSFEASLPTDMQATLSWLTQQNDSSGVY